jgi:hypothetical protein
MTAAHAFIGLPNHGQVSARVGGMLAHQISKPSRFLYDRQGGVDDDVDIDLT